MKILNVTARQILDSRGTPTLETSILLDDGSEGVFQVPSGASTGIHEALELRDEDKNTFFGKSVEKAINNIARVKSEIIDRNFDQFSLDEKLKSLDGTENKELLGANALLGISVAFSKACAKYYNIPLYQYLRCLIRKTSFSSKKKTKLKEPFLFANILNGGLHAGNDLNIQEFMIIPNIFPLSKAVQATSEIYHELKNIIASKYSSSQTAVGDEGGFAPQISTPYEAFDLLEKAVKNCKYEGKIFYAIDAAASDFYNVKEKTYEIEKGKQYDYKELSSYYQQLCKKYPIISIEDPFEEDDFEAFSYFLKHKKNLSFTNPLTNKKELLLVGDDLLVTNPKRIDIAQKKNLCNALLLKINQIGTLSESLEAFNLARKKDWQVIVSHRSGETTDDFIADLACALDSNIKLGAPARGERVVKYNRLLQILQ